MLSRGSLVEKVARALAETHGKSAVWHDFQGEACAAIAAMRVPSQAMLEAAGAGVIDYSHIDQEWQLMVDTALSENESRAPEN
jgi:hypothetical protein